MPTFALVPRVILCSSSEARQVPRWERRRHRPGADDRVAPRKTCAKAAATGSSFRQGIGGRPIQRPRHSVLFREPRVLMCRHGSPVASWNRMSGVDEHRCPAGAGGRSGRRHQPGSPWIPRSGLLSLENAGARCRRRPGELAIVDRSIRGRRIGNVEPAVIPEERSRNERQCQSKFGQRCHSDHLLFVKVLPSFTVGRRDRHVRLDAIGL